MGRVILTVSDSETPGTVHVGCTFDPPLTDGKTSAAQAAGVIALTAVMDAVEEKVAETEGKVAL